MDYIEVAMPEIPEDGWFSNWAANIISGGDKDLEEVLTRKYN